jgi:hypothetical protein
MDGKEEWSQIKDVDKATNVITCDLQFDHEEGSLIIEGRVPLIIQKLTSVIGAIMAGVYMIGSTYTFATSYSIPDHSVTKGVPYPHFVKVLDELLKERDKLISQLPPIAVFA